MLQKKEINKLLDDLQDYLFPGFFSNKVIGKDDVVFDLCKIFKKLEVKEYKANKFVNKIEEIKKLLLKDVEATFNGDPASKSYEEIIMSYPGLYAIMVYRLSHELYINEVPMLPRLMSEIAHSKTGIDIHPGPRRAPMPPARKIYPAPSIEPTTSGTSATAALLFFDCFTER